jgi:hypothetical protein
MTLYLITQGEYSDYAFVAAFTDKALAKRWLEKYNRTGSRYDSYRIEEWGITTSEPVVREVYYLNENGFTGAGPRMHTQTQVVAEGEEYIPSMPGREFTPFFHAQGLDPAELWAKHAEWKASK